MTDEQTHNVVPVTVDNIKDLLRERGKTHGAFEDHAAVTQNIKAAMYFSANWNTLSQTRREALDMIAHKIGRILSGDPGHADHWDDICGYATLAKDK